MSTISPKLGVGNRRVSRVEVNLYINGQTVSAYRNVEDFTFLGGVAQFVNVQHDGKAELITSTLPFKVIALLEDIGEDA